MRGVVHVEGGGGSYLYFHHIEGREVDGRHWTVRWNRFATKQALCVAFNTTQCHLAGRWSVFTRTESVGKV